jgi:hypothetical protein
MQRGPWSDRWCARRVQIRHLPGRARRRREPLPKGRSVVGGVKSSRVARALPSRHLARWEPLGLLSVLPRLHTSAQRRPRLFDYACEVELSEHRLQACCIAQVLGSRGALRHA